MTSKFLSHVRTRLLNMNWSKLRFNVWRSFVTMATNLPYCFSIQFLEQLLKFLVNFTLLKYVKSQRSYGFLVTKELIFGFQILDLKDHFSASLKDDSITTLAATSISSFTVSLDDMKPGYFLLFLSDLYKFIWPRF